MAKGEDFTIVIRGFASAGYSKAEVLEAVEGMFANDVANKTTYLYPHESKIYQQSILEVTGVWRDPIARPVITEDLRDALEYYLSRAAKRPDCTVIE